MNTSKQCEYRVDEDPDTLEPLGPACGSVATQIIRWAAGDTSPACKEHGINSLTQNGLVLVASVVSVDGATLYETGQA